MRGEPGAGVWSGVEYKSGVNCPNQFDPLEYSNVDILQELYVFFLRLH